MYSFNKTLKTSSCIIGTKIMAFVTGGHDMSVGLGVVSGIVAFLCVEKMVISLFDSILSNFKWLILEGF